MKHLFKSLSVIALGLAALQAEAKFKVVTTFTVIQDIDRKSTRLNSSH